ncbi:MAG: molybdopterin-dependent oxidoreductase, partial [bacterium]
PDRLPGGWANDETLRAELAQDWTIPLPERSGLSGPEMLREAAQGNLDALIVLGGEALAQHPQPDLVRRALDSVKSLIVIDLFPSVASEKATVLLPAANFFEKDGTFLSIEGEASALARAAVPQEDTRPEVQILLSLAVRLEKTFSYAGFSALTKEVLHLVGKGRDIDLRDLRARGPGRESPIRATVFRKDAPRAEFRVRFNEPVAAFSGNGVERAKRSDGEFILLWDNLLNAKDHYGDRSETMAPLRKRPFVEIGREDAKRLGIYDRDTVVLSIGTQTEECAVRVRGGLSAGCAYIALNLSSLRLPEPLDRLPVVRIKKTSEAKK